MKHEQQPDTQGNSTDGLGGGLPYGSSTHGMTANSHPGQSLADVHRGYDVFDPGAMSEAAREDTTLTPAQQDGGVVGRASGWER